MVGVRVMPVFAVKSGAFFAAIVGVLGLMGGLLQINPIWNLGPYTPSQVSAGSQPDFYLMWTDGLVRLWPAWDFYFWHHTIPAAAAVAVLMGLIFVVLVVYPFLEKRFTGDHAHHNLLQRPRDVPVRTSIGAMAIAFYNVLTFSSFNDIIAYQFHVSLNAMTWIGRIGMVVLPPIVYFVTYRWCVALQRSDRAVLEHGIETGIIKRLPHGAYIEVHQPLGPVDDYGHPTALPYQGAAVPKRLNKLGLGGRPGSGSLLFADPPSENAVLRQAAHAGEQLALTALRRRQNGTESRDNDGNGHQSGFVDVRSAQDGRLGRGLARALPPAVVAAEVADLDDQPGQAQRARAHRHQVQQRRGVTGERVAEDDHGGGAGKQAGQRGQRVRQGAHGRRAGGVVDRREWHGGNQPQRQHGQPAALS